MGEKTPDWIASACTRCGKCCLNKGYMLTLSATAKDVARWRKEGRDDILRHVDQVSPGVYDLWFDDGWELGRCPFLRKDRGAATYRCKIHDTRPEQCRSYPATYGKMVADECEIIHAILAAAEAIHRSQTIADREKQGQVDRAIQCGF